MLSHFEAAEDRRRLAVPQWVRGSGSVGVQNLISPKRLMPTPSEEESGGAAAAAAAPAGSSSSTSMFSSLLAEARAQRDRVMTGDSSKLQGLRLLRTVRQIRDEVCYVLLRCCTEQRDRGRGERGQGTRACCRAAPAGIRRPGPASPTHGTVL